MREEIEGRLWDENGAEFTTAIWKWISELSAAFVRLNERNYSAPWRTAQPRNCSERSA